MLFCESFIRVYEIFQMYVFLFISHVYTLFIFMSAHIIKLSMGVFYRGRVL